MRTIFHNYTLCQKKSKIYVKKFCVSYMDQSMTVFMIYVTICCIKKGEIESSLLLPRKISPNQDTLLSNYQSLYRRFVSNSRVIYYLKLAIVGVWTIKGNFVYTRVLNTLKSAVHWKVIRSWRNMQLKATGLLECVWPFSGHQALTLSAPTPQNG